MIGSVEGRTRDILRGFGTTVRSSRHARRWTQRRLAAATGLTQGYISKLERARVPELSFGVAMRILETLDARMDVRFHGLPAASSAQRDRAHARCVAYVARRLAGHGFEVATEVDVGGDRWRGFADAIAFHTIERVLLVVEVKTEIHDLGEIDRQLGVAERGAWEAARARGWRPRAVTGVLLVLSTAENDRRLADNRAYFERGYPIRHRTVNDWLRRPQIAFRRGDRALAMIDPATRRRDWLLAAWIDGRRTPAAYESRAAYLARPKREPEPEGARTPKRHATGPAPSRHASGASGAPGPAEAESPVGRPVSSTS